jgi:hypothetical protein
MQRRRAAVAKPHYVWHNFFLPGENLATMSTVAALRTALHESAGKRHETHGVPTALTTEQTRVGLHYRAPMNHVTPDFYYRKLFVR